MTKPRTLTPREIASGRFPAWAENYATWLSEQPSFQNETNRARWGRTRALRALRKHLTKTFGGAYSEEVIQHHMDDIRELAFLKARADLNE